MSTPVSYQDAASVTHSFETEDGDVGGTTRPVHGMPDDVKANIAGTAVSAATLAGAVSAAKVATADAQLHTDLSPPSGGPKTGQVTVGVAAVQFGPQALTRGFYVKNLSPGGQLLYISPSSGVTSANSWVLAPGESSPFIEATNVTAIYMLASAASGLAAYIGS